ncbi:kinase-like protein [Pseudovirgaria hyperparasitica]|uniref:Kinase-like protein n=1 Tax=Pseudovirgaria hyperparasitica TaxID=470096 RepID=A0A6A6VXE8_9PEZI|nr:kinase-like protein [Pseudovirgaria hyperparasitica]KAF2753937.1 kinase-like protein [Pseudovirgaria hyperparasitica]
MVLTTETRSQAEGCKSCVRQSDDAVGENLAEQLHAREISEISQASEAYDPTRHLSNSEIVKACRRPPHDHSLGIPSRVVRILSNAIVKLIVSQAEADNQRFIFNKVNPEVCRVPRVYRYFKHDGKGYLVMEYIEGVCIPANAMTPKQYAILARALAHLYSFKRTTPGNLAGEGKCFDCPLPETGVDFMGDVNQMNAWFQSRLLEWDTTYRFNFDPGQFVICHRDIAPRNILWQQDESICLLDWETAGFFPVSFDLCSQRKGIPQDFAFNQAVERLIATMSSVTVDMEEVRHLEQAWRCSEKYAFAPPCQAFDLRLIASNPPPDIDFTVSNPYCPVSCAQTLEAMQAMPKRSGKKTIISRTLRPSLP